MPSLEELIFSPDALQAPDAFCGIVRLIPASVIDEYSIVQAERTKEEV